MSVANQMPTSQPQSIAISTYRFDDLDIEVRTIIVPDEKTAHLV